MQSEATHTTITEIPAPTENIAPLPISSSTTRTYAAAANVADVSMLRAASCAMTLLSTTAVNAR
jgi:hypothetical protein